MTGWLIAAGVIAGIFLLLLIPVQLRLSYRQTFTAELKYLFLRFRLTNIKPQQEPAPKSTKKAKKTSFFQKIKEWEASLGVDSVPEALSKLTSLLKETLNRTAWLLKRSTLSRLELTVTVGGEDAAASAMTYGALCAAVYPLLSWATGLFRRVRHQQVDLQCGFDRPDTTAAATVWISITPLGALRAAAGLVWAFMKLQKKAETKEVSLS